MLRKTNLGTAFLLKTPCIEIIMFKVGGLFLDVSKIYRKTPYQILSKLYSTVTHSWPDSDWLKSVPISP